MPLSLFILLMFLACNSPDFKEFSELGDLRIMGIVADKPEIDGNSTAEVQVKLTPYLSDIKAAGRKFKVTVVTCLDPGVSQGAAPQCLKPKIAMYPNANTFDTRVLAAANYTGAMDSVTISIANPAGEIAALSKQQKYNGVNYLVIFNLTSGSTSLTAVKAISIAERQVLNSNPEIADIVLDEQDRYADWGFGKIDVAFTAKGKQERYDEMLADGSINSLSESYFITWFYHKGKVKPSRVLLAQPATYQVNTSGDTLVAVVKDRRGGTDVSIMQF